MINVRVILQLISLFVDDPKPISKMLKNFFI